ncbi:MAG: hypothetical protein IJA30_05505 [Bacilli bacterium]|nr:hypothetical protein [Bacilli bacterium]
MANLRQINNELKTYINEATFISNKCRNKLLKYLGETFNVELPLENFAKIDAEITEEGNIIMRGDEYKTSSPVKTEEELEEKYNVFKEKAEILLKKKEVNYYTKNNINNTLNIFIVIALSIIYVIVLIFAIREVLSLNLFTASILFAILSSSLIPNIKARFEQAKNFLKRKFKK